jgi:putative transposase
VQPIESLWAYLKRAALANFCPKSLRELKEAWRSALNKARAKPGLIASFFRTSAIGKTTEA